MEPELTKVQIHPAHRCNLKCMFCDVPVMNVGKVDLEDEKWMQIVKELCELHPKMVTISGGGEPLLRTALLIKIMKILHSSDIGIELITNGTLISDEVTKTIAECCDHYRVSLHSTSTKMDEFLRGVKGSVNLSFEGIKKIVYWKGKMKRENPKIDIAMVLTKFNIDEIEKMIKKASSLGANMLSLRIVHKGGEKYRPSKKQMGILKKNLKKYETMATENSLEFHCDFLQEDVFSTHKNTPIKTEDQKNQPICMLPFREIVIFSDGRVASCCNFIYDYEDSIAIDSTKNKTIGQIWFGEKFNSFRECMLRKSQDQLPARCKECSIDLKPIDQAYKTSIKSV